MKANELMIGDWLYSIIDRYDHIEKKPVKITGIRTEDDELLQGNDSDVWYHIETYEPIPLTAELLEKNGFVDRKSNYAFSNQKASVYYWINDRILSLNSYGDVLHINCQYVHQLQHTLKLCNIQKEIQL